MPRIIAGDDKFRLVRIEDGNKVTYILEKPDGCDALGEERWREVSQDAPIIRALRDWIIRAVVQAEKETE